MAETVAGLLPERAREAPDGLAFGYLGADGTIETTTYAELDRAARRIAVAVGDALAPQSRALLVLPPGLDFVRALFGTLYAGVVAVPVYPPIGELRAALERLGRIATDAGAEAVVTLDGLDGHLRAVDAAGALDGLRWLAADRCADEADAWFDRGATPDDIAILQYTSGSTSQPKGVVLRNRNLLANQRVIQQAMRIAPGKVAVSWLPMYHDMGLIGFVIQPLFAGIPAYLMSPLDFLERPQRWLEAIARVGGTSSGAPTFAYDLCLRRIPDAALEDLDLSSWELAFCGADMVAAQTLRDFAARFEPCGFSPRALFPCYGLAEATLIVTGSDYGAGLRTRWVTGAGLGRNAVEPADAGDGDAREIVCVGSPGADHEVLVVDPATGAPRSDDRVGEIWVRGPSVATGYWNEPAATAATFDAVTESGDAGWLRTGDLGFCRGSDVYVTGRIKDVIVVHGRNVYPHDVELAAQAADRRLRAGCGAAFAVDGEGVVLVQETRATDAAELELLAERAAVAAVAATDGVPLAAVALVPPRTVPKTSSGKVRRAACRDAWAAGRLEALYERRTPVGVAR
jgi:acyl-CoA synthetase (AMP-forming)/AMP-acid ligase II